MPNGVHLPMELLECSLFVGLGMVVLDLLNKAPKKEFVSVLTRRWWPASMFVDGDAPSPISRLVEVVLVMAETGASLLEATTADRRSSSSVGFMAVCSSSRRCCR